MFLCNKTKNMLALTFVCYRSNEFSVMQNHPKIPQPCEKVLIMEGINCNKV